MLNQRLERPIGENAMKPLRELLVFAYENGRAENFLLIVCYIGLRNEGASWQRIADEAGVSRRTLYIYRKRWPFLERLLQLPVRAVREAPEGYTGAELGRGETRKEGR